MAPQKRKRPTTRVEMTGHFLTREQFLAHFPKLDITREEFTQRFQVNYQQPQSLHELFARVPGVNGKVLIRTLDDKRLIKRDRIIDMFYHIIVEDRENYLAGIYAAYFTFTDPLAMNWDTIDLRMTTEGIPGIPGISSQKNDGSKRLIRNLFYRELLDETRVTNTVKSRVSFWQSLVNMFNHLELEDRFFAPSSLDLCLAADRNLFYLFQAYQPKASIFNPYTIKWILTEVVDRVLGYPGATLFTPVLSWSAYLMAFMHSSYTTYVGLDVMPSVCEKNAFLADWYAERGLAKSTRILCQPSERMELPEYREYFDTIMVCPPYYTMELYAEGEQSTTSYPDYAAWLEGYWRATVARCLTLSRPGGVFALIINDYQDLNGRHYALTTDLDAIVQDYYVPLHVFYLKNRTSPLRTTTKDRTEKLFIYRKPVGIRA